MKTLQRIILVLVMIFVTPSALSAVNLERVPAQVSERAWRQYQSQAQRTDDTPAAPAPAVEAVPSPPAPAPTPVATTPVTVPQNLPTFTGQLVRVTPETVVIRHHESGEQKILQRSGVLIKDVVVGDEVAVQYAPDREALVTIQPVK